MLDVAALAGVGLATVSRVVNGKAGVSAVTVARVQSAIDRLDYRHNVNASSLRRLDRKTATIGLLLEDVSNPFMSSLHRAIEDAVRERGMLVFAGSCDENAERERELISALRARRVDGLVVVPAAGDHSYLLPELRHGTAMVFVDRPAGFLDADAVVSDNAGGVRAAVTHLVAHGHRRIGYLGAVRGIATASERLDGYQQGLARAGIALDERLVRMELNGMAEGEAATAVLLAAGEPPTAIVSGQNFLTIGAIKALRARGLQRQVGLVGFDDFLLADLLEPAVTVIAQDPAELGRRAAELLLLRLDGDRSPSRRIECPVELVPRGSGEIAA
jgi:LacI family transcriptional regulator